MNEEDLLVHIDQYNFIRRQNEQLRDALGFYATDESDDGWVAIHALEFAGTKDYIFQKNLPEDNGEMV